MITRSIRRRVADWALRAVPVITALVFGASQASASFVESGTTHPSSGPGGTVTSGIIAFAVYDLSGGTPSDPYNIGAGNPFTAANASWMFSGAASGGNFLYLYGILNDQAPSAVIAGAMVDVAAPIISAGEVAGGVAFFNGIGPVNVFSTASPTAIQNAPALVTGPVPAFAGGGQEPLLFSSVGGPGVFYGLGAGGILQGQNRLSSDTHRPSPPPLIRRQSQVHRVPMAPWSLVIFLPFPSPRRS